MIRKQENVGDTEGLFKTDDRNTTEFIYLLVFSYSVILTNAFQLMALKNEVPI